jgi:glycosyltransferase involved in cell wall biosynthesis
MKVVIVSDEVAPYSIEELQQGIPVGGVSTYTFYLTKSLSEFVDVTLVTHHILDRSYYPFKVKSANCWTLYGKMFPLDLRTTYTFYKMIKEEKPDIVHATDSYSYFCHFSITYARHKKKPTVISHHSIDFPDCIAKKFFYYGLFGPSLDKVGRVIVPGKKSAESLSTIMRNKDKIRIIPHGVENPPVFEKNFSVRELYDIDNSFLIVSPMRIENRKDPWTLLEGFCKLKKIIPESKLVIIGDGSKTNKLKQKIEEKGMNDSIYLTGRLPHSFTLKAMKEADVVALTSRIESFGLVTLEAMSVGTPVVCTGVGEIPEIIENEENGLLIPPGDCDALANACIRLYDDCELVKKLSKNGLKKVKEFSWKKTAKRTLEVYEEVCEEHRKSH